MTRLQPWGKGITGRGHSKSKDLEVGARLVYRDKKVRRPVALEQSKGEGRLAD